MKFDKSRVRRIGRLFSGVALVTGIAVPLLSSPTSATSTPSLPPFGTSYVVNHSSDSITVISPQGSVVTTIKLPSGSAPNTIAISPDDTTAWVADSGSGHISEINLTTNTYFQDFPLPSGEKAVSASINTGSGYNGLGLLDVVETGASSQVVAYNIPSFTTASTYAPPLGAKDTQIAQAGDGSSFELLESCTTTSNSCPNGASGTYVQFVEPNGMVSIGNGANLVSPLGSSFSNYYLAHGDIGYTAYVAEAGTNSGQLVCTYNLSSYKSNKSETCPSNFQKPIPLAFEPTAIASSPDGNTIVVVGVHNPNTSNATDEIEVVGLNNGGTVPTKNTYTPYNTP